MEKIFKKELEQKFVSPQEIKCINIELIDENNPGEPMKDRIEKLIDKNAKYYSHYDIARYFDDKTFVPVYTLLLYK